MLFTVEVRLTGGDMVATMSKMRTWLDHNRCEPDAFRQSGAPGRAAFRIEFKNEKEARAFAEAFGGRVIAGAAVIGGQIGLRPERERAAS